MSALAQRVLVPLAALGLVLALGWWWRTFGEVVGYGYLSWKEAGRCLLSDSDICSLAKALCLGSHPRAYWAYESAAFWAGLALLGLGMALGAPRMAKA